MVELQFHTQIGPPRPRIHKRARSVSLDYGELLISDQNDKGQEESLHRAGRDDDGPPPKKLKSSDKLVTESVQTQTKTIKVEQHESFEPKVAMVIPEIYHDTPKETKRSSKPAVNTHTIFHQLECKHRQFRYEERYLEPGHCCICDYEGSEDSKHHFIYPCTGKGCEFMICNRCHNKNKESNGKLVEGYT